MPHLPGTPSGASARLLLAVCAATLLLVGCGPGTPPPPPPDAPPPPAAITLEELQAADYPADILDGNLVRLSGGVFPPPDSSGDPVASLELAVPVAIEAPGATVARAAVVVRESGGGTGMFAWLHLLERSQGAPKVVASIYLGDRVDLVSLRLVGDTIEARLVTQGPTDPLCCPTLEVRKRFYLEDGKLREAVSSKQ